MPEKKTMERAVDKKRRGAAPSTQASEFVREEMEHVKEGKHGAKSSAQAVAIGLSKARRSGVAVPPPAKGRAKPSTRRKATRDVERGQETGALSGARGRGKTTFAKKPASRAANATTHGASKPAAKTASKSGVRKRAAGRRNAVRGSANPAS